MRPLAISVLTAPQGTHLCDVADLREELGVPSTDAGQVKLLTRLVDAATQTIQKYCNRVFAEQTVLARYAGGQRYLLLNQLPVQSIASLVDGDGDAVEVAYEINDGGILQAAKNLPLDVRLTYTGGYRMPTQPGVVRDLPIDIEQACIALARTFFLRSGRSADIESQSVDGAVDVAFMAEQRGIPIDVLDLVEPYRLYAL